MRTIWEYKTVGISTSQDLEQILNKFGNDGWELVQVVHTSTLVCRDHDYSPTLGVRERATIYLHGEPYHDQLLFKRAKALPDAQALTPEAEQAVSRLKQLMNRHRE